MRYYGLYGVSMGFDLGFLLYIVILDGLSTCVGIIVRIVGFPIPLLLLSFSAACRSCRSLIFLLIRAARRGVFIILGKRSLVVYQVM